MIRIAVQACVFTLLLGLMSTHLLAAQVKAVYQGSFSHTSTSGTSTQDISLPAAVDTSSTFLVFQTTHNDGDPPGASLLGRIEDANTLRFRSVDNGARTMQVQWYVVEYESGVRVQRGELSQSATNFTATLPQTIDRDQAFMTWSKTARGSDRTWGTDDVLSGWIESDTRLRFRARSRNSNHQIWWQVVEYLTPGEASVQVLTSSLSRNQTQRDLSINAVNLDQSFILSSHNVTGGGTNLSRKTLTTEFIGNDTVRVTRENGGENISNIAVQVVQINDGSIVRSGLSTLAVGEGSKAESLSAPIESDNAIALTSVNSAGGQNMGRTQKTNGDIVGVAAATLELSDTSITLQRNNASAQSTFSWFAIDFSAVMGPSSLVAHIEFEDGNWPGNAAELGDSTGNGNSGRGAGQGASRPYTTNSGRMCKAALFDGSSYFDLGNKTDFSFEETFTLSAWVYPTSLGPSLRTVASKDQNYEFHVNAQGGVFWWWQNSSNQTRSFSTANGLVPLDTWTHIAITYSMSSGRQRIYVNGVERASRSYAESLRQVSQPLQIGADQGITSRQWIGKIDDLRLYESELTASEIADLHLEPNPCFNGLVAHYDFESGPWTGASDELTNQVGGVGLNGIGRREIPSQELEGYVCEAASFPDNAYFEIADDPLLDMDDELTIALWIYPTQPTGNYDGLVSKEGNYELFLTSDRRLRWWWIDNNNQWTSFYTAANAVGLNEWTHVAMVYNRGEQAQRLYINGMQVASNIYDAELVANNSILDIGNDDNGSGNRRYSGSMDELRIYNVALNDAEIQTLASVSNPCAIPYCYTEDFNSDADLDNDWSVSHQSGSFGDPRIVSGRLRMTSNTNNNAGVASLLRRFPSSGNRVEVQFDAYQYGGSGADGMAVIFSNANDAPISGQFGGSLGYAQRYGSLAGFNGGWMGIGIDGWGNYSRNSEGRTGYTGTDGMNNFGPQRPDSVAIRGSGSGTVGYHYLSGTQTLSPAVRTSAGHRYRIIIDSQAGQAQTSASVERDTGSGFEELIPNFKVYDANPTQAAIPQDLLLSFSASTGGAHNFHEIDNLSVCASQPIQAYNAVDHFRIEHAGLGVTCEASDITITAMDSQGDPVPVSVDTPLDIRINGLLDSESSDWSIAGSTEIASGQSAVTFSLRHLVPGTNLDIDVEANGVTEDAGVDDPPITFVDSALQLLSGTSTLIGTQISGKPSNQSPNASTLRIRSVRTDQLTGACNAALTGSQSIDFTYQCINPSSCGADAMFIDGSLVSSSAYTARTLNFDSNGEASFIAQYNEAGQIKLLARADVPASGDDPAITLLGESNEYVVRPFGFDLDVPNSANTNSASANTFVAAGSDFNIDVQAVAWQSSDDTDQDGQPDRGANLSDNALVRQFGQERFSDPVALAGATFTSHSLVAPSGGSTGIFEAQDQNVGGNQSGFSDGAGSISARWDEVGIIDVDVSVFNYLGASGANVTGSALNVGRFYLSQFELLVEADGSFEGSCSVGGAFSYVGQPFGYNVLPSVQIIPQYRRADGTIGGVSNYNFGGAFNKLTAGGVQVLVDTLAPGLPSVTSSLNSGTLSAFNVTDTRYQFSAADLFSFDKDLTPIAPFTGDIPFTVTVSDSDGASAISTLNINPAGHEQRYGRWRMKNVVGSELAPLNFDAGAEYYDGSTYVPNTLDNCTSLVGRVTSNPVQTPSGNQINNIPVGSGTSDFSFSSPLSSGQGGWMLSAPGSGNVGTVQLNVDLSGLPWLRGQWDADVDLDDHPPVSGTFGAYRGNDRVIYWREISN